MGEAKNIIIKPISSQDANAIIKKLHYSGKVVNNSQVHFGVFLDGICGGALQFGPSLDKRKIIGLVKDTKWNEFIELNRMALADWLPRNGESRAISICMRLLKKHYPFLKWVISFADGTQCGDGTIYRASGFILTGIKKNDQIWIAPDETHSTFSRMSLTDNSSHKEQKKAMEIITRFTMTKGKNLNSLNGASSMKSFIEAGFKPLHGFQLRYIYFLDPSYKDKLTVPIIPFSRIGEMGAGMYKGVKRIADDSNSFPKECSGLTPTDPLQNSDKDVFCMRDGQRIGYKDLPI